MRRTECGPGAALALAAAVACAPLSIPEERALGEDVDREVRSEVRLVHDEAVERYVREIGARIVDASAPHPFDYRFHVVDEPKEVNAFALPAGYIYIHTAILLNARSVSEVAGVMGHEVGHVARRHVANNYRRQQGVGILRALGVITAAVLGGGLAAEAANLGGGLAAMAYLNTFSRDAEHEADAFAVEVLPKAGYDPNGLVSFFDTLMRQSGGGGPEFLSSHPATESRIEDSRALIRAADLPDGLDVHDGGRLEVIQRRIRLITGD